MMVGCACAVDHPPKLVVVTGGPGAGKTAALEVVQREFCRHVVVLPEAASILWRGGYPRRGTSSARRSAQRTIVKVQHELQRMAIEDGSAAMIVCDRGTLDGLAYWPGEAAEYFAELETTVERELARYAAVIHMRPPTLANGYTITPLRPETAEQAQALDLQILAAWSAHPRRVVIESNHDFLEKLERAIALIRDEIPSCCRT